MKGEVETVDPKIYGPTCYFLMGAPGSGKSTFADRMFNSYERLSSDAHLERIARSVGISYNEAFRHCIKLSMELVDRDLDRLVQMNCDFVWDQTNLTVASRTKKIKTLKDQGYKIEGHAFYVPYSLLLERHRNRGASKFIPLDTLESMYDSFVLPTCAEGFDTLHIHTMYTKE